MPKIKVFCRFNCHNGGNIILFGSHETEYDNGSIAEIHIINGRAQRFHNFRHFRHFSAF